MAFLDIEKAVKSFDGTTVIDRVECAIDKSEFFCILGPSGCGKSTLLRLIAGLEHLDSGTIAVDDRMMSGPAMHVPPEERNVGIVFQSYALWPHMTVAGNVEYPLRTAKVDNAIRRRETDAALRAVHMTPFAERRPHTLSGGQQQRVALARCLTQKPGVVLMDEPLANLDMHLRGEMLREFRAFRDSSGSTIVYITHDQSEAMSVADRIAVMFDGRLVQIASPEKLYAEPANAAVARFIGISSILRARPNGGKTVDWSGHHVPVRGTSGPAADGPIDVCVRPESVVVGDGPIMARIVAATYLGGRYLTELIVGNDTLHAYVEDGYRPSIGEAVACTIRDAWMMPTADPVAS